MPTAAAQQALADATAAVVGGKPQPPPQASPDDPRATALAEATFAVMNKPPTIPVGPASMLSRAWDATKGEAGKAWDYVNSPIDAVKPLAKKLHDISDAPITMDDVHAQEEGGVKNFITHPVKRFAAGVAGDALNMFGSPVGIATAAAGPLIKGVGAIPALAKTVPALEAALSGLGVAYGAQGVKDVAQHGVKQLPGESDADYARRLLGDAAMITGGGAGVAGAAHIATREPHVAPVEHAVAPTEAPAAAPVEARAPRVHLPSDPIIIPKQPTPVPEDYVAGKPMTPWEMEQQRADDVVARAKDELANEASRQPFTINDRRAGFKANDGQLPEIQRAEPTPTTRDVPLPGGGAIRLPWDTAPTAMGPEGEPVRLPFASTPQVPEGFRPIRSMRTGVFPDLDQRVKNLTQPQKLLPPPLQEAAQQSASLPEFLDKLTGKDEADIAAAKLTPEKVFEQAKGGGNASALNPDQRIIAEHRSLSDEEQDNLDDDHWQRYGDAANREQARRIAAGEPRKDFAWNDSTSRILQHRVGGITYSSRDTGGGIEVRATDANGKRIATTSLNPTGSGGKEAFTSGVKVPSELQRQGIGKELYKQLPAIAKKYGIEKIVGEGVQSEAGQNLWRSLERDGAAKPIQAFDQTRLGMTTEGAPDVHVPADEKVPTEVGNSERKGGSGQSPELAAGSDGGVAPAAQPSDIGRTRVADLNLDPKRFQYKMNTDAQGATNLLKGNRWNDDLAGIVSTWKDPADGKTYVVNGHHRVALAKENGVADIPTRELKAPTAESARSTGAMQNIAEGRGTAVDAAKFMRDKGLSVEDIGRMGISMGEATAAKGAALARLDPYIFDAVAQGRMPEGRGVAIGKATDNPATQEAIMKLIDKAEKSGKSVTNETVAELARFASNAPESTQTSMGLFGETHEVNSTALEKAEVSAYIQKQLRQEKATFAAVSSEARAKRLSEAGNTINAGENAARADEADQHLEVYRRLSERAGPIDSVLNDAAKEIADGGSQSAVKQRAYESVRSEVAKALAGGEGSGDSGNAAVGDGSPNSPADNGADDRQGELGDGTTFRHAGLDPRPALKQAGEFYREKIAQPLQEKLVGKWVTRRPEVDRIDPELSGQLNVYDNLHHFTKAKADAVIHDVLSPIYDEFGVTPKGKQINDAYRGPDGQIELRAKGVSKQQMADRGFEPMSKEEAFEAARAKERLLVLMADGDSRANLRENHPDEYQQAVNDPSIQKALEIYHPVEQEISQQRAGLGGTNLEGDYLKRVYGEYLSGINKPRVPGGADRAFDALSRLVSEKSETGPQFNQQRKANAEYYYQNGLHEFGPSFGPKYLGTARRFGTNEVIRQLAEHATPVAPGDELPPSIDYNGQTFYRSDIANDLRQTGKDAKTYDIFDPTQGQTFKSATQQYLAPTEIVEQMNGTKEMPDTSAPGIKRWMQDNALAFGLGIPHAANLMRRFAQVTNLDPREAGRVIFSPELRERAANALADETATSLAERGALRTGDEDKIAGYIRGNLNPLNWDGSYFSNAMKKGGLEDGKTTPATIATAPLKIAQDIISRINSYGHKALFDPTSFGGFGGLDQRVRIAAADYLKANKPGMSDTDIASTVNKAFGDYQRANWSNQQKMLSNFLFFPGFETSTFQWILDHPLKTAGAGAMANLLINRSLNLLDQNKEEDKNDLTAVHVGGRTFGIGLINEGMAMKLAAPLLAGLRSYVLDDNTGQRALGDAAAKVPEIAKAFTDPLIPYVKLPLDFAYGKFAGRDLTKPEDKYTPGTLGNKANDKYAAAIASELVPEFNSVQGATGKQGIDPLSLLGRMTGVTNRKVDGASRVSTALGQAIIADKLYSAATKDGDPAKAKALLERDPDTVVYAAFSPALEQQNKRMKEWDEAAQLIDQSLTGDDKKKAMEQVAVEREKDVQVSDELADALHLAITKVHAARQNQQRTQTLATGVR